MEHIIYVTLHYITLHYVTLHYIHTHTYTYASMTKKSVNIHMWQEMYYAILRSVFDINPGKKTLAKRPSSLGPKHQLQIRWSHNYRSQYATDLSHWLHLVWTPVATVRIWSGRYFCWIYRFEIFNFQPVVWYHNQLSQKIQLQEIGEVLDLHVIDLGDVLFGRMSLC